VQCPYCGESFDTTLDLSAGSTSYIEDCQVCCQPIEFTVAVADDGTLASLEARRGD
jgi:Cysteine-rich CPXCG